MLPCACLCQLYSCWSVPYMVAYAKYHFGYIKQFSIVVCLTDYGGFLFIKCIWAKISGGKLTGNYQFLANIFIDFRVKSILRKMLSSYTGWYTIEKKKSKLYTVGLKKKIPENWMGTKKNGEKYRISFALQSTQLSCWLIPLLRVTLIYPIYMVYYLLYFLLCIVPTYIIYSIFASL